MKNQYFGDINDYRKYGILRALQAGSGLPLAVCWMLTPDDEGSDGRKVEYLSNPDRWRHYDPEVYDALQTALLDNTRSIEAAERSFLSSAVSHPDIVGHRLAERCRFFTRLLERISGPSLVFLDPDNGMEVKSKPAGLRGAEKYLYWKELEDVYRVEHSCLIYQHFPRLPREAYKQYCVREVAVRLGAPWVATLVTSHVLFLLAPQEPHADRLEAGLRLVRTAWKNEVRVQLHHQPVA